MQLIGQVHGFLPTRGSWMLDMVTVAMVLIVALMLFSIWLVKSRKQYRAHRTIQISLALILVVALIVFEVDVRFFTDWRQLAVPSPYYESGLVSTVLLIHLLFAIPTPFIWGAVIVLALKRFQVINGKAQFVNDHAPWHRTWAKVAAGMMILTAVTGWVFYWMAFVAE